MDCCDSGNSFGRSGLTKNFQTKKAGFKTSLFCLRIFLIADSLQFDDLLVSPIFKGVVCNVFLRIAHEL